METIPLRLQFAALAVLLVISGFFSIAETSMMALNRYRLKHLVGQGHGGAKRASALLAQTHRLLGVILLCNNLVNAGAATLVSVITIRLFGNGELALGLGTLAVTFLILVFSEITPKVIGAAYAERVALPLAYILGPLLRLFSPVVWFVNLFVAALLKILRIDPSKGNELQQLSTDEIRTLVLESGQFMPKKHRSILVNLFDLDNITVQDIMLPRAKIESVTLEEGLDQVAHQLATAYHMRLPVFRNREGDLAGVLHLRKVLGLLHAGELTNEAIEELADEPYFVPGSTAVLAQLQFFQENAERLALVVDEYGEIMGLVTLEDIIEEIIGKFTTSLPSAVGKLGWDAAGSALADGAMPVREINRALNLNLPLDGPKTLNGLILEHLQDIPEADVSIRIEGVAMEILHTQGRAVKAVRIFRPPESAPTESDDI
ncbi:MAG: HlyC/CorC family transporter [Betaproteobacteria bacterium]